MRRLFVILLFSLSLTALAQQQKVAVYVTAVDGIEEATKQIVGTELVTALVANPAYDAVERTADFLNTIQKEHGYQRSGNVDDQQIRNLGKQFGASLVCVANIMPFQNAYYIQARLLNVETASVEAAARETSSLSSIDDFVSAAESLASKLVGKQADLQKYGNEYSSVLYSEEDCILTSIDNTGRSAVATFKYITARPQQIKMSPNVYIIDNKTGDTFRALEVSGIGSANFTYANAGILTFTVTFEKLPNNISSIDIIEPRGWSWTKITLKPYDRANYFVFRDNSKNIYNNLAQKEQIAAERARAQEQRQREEQAERAAQQQAMQDNLQNGLDRLGEAIRGYQQVKNSYVLEIHNTKNYPIKVVLDGRILGIINAYKTEEFLLDINLYGKLQLIQQSGYLFSPTTYTRQVPKQNAQTRLIYSTPN